jgi:hypothetical protein
MPGTDHHPAPPVRDHKLELYELERLARTFDAIGNEIGGARYPAVALVQWLADEYSATCRRGGQRHTRRTMTRSGGGLCPHGVPWLYVLDVPSEDWHAMTAEERALCHAHLGHHCDCTPRLDEALIAAQRAATPREESVTG